MSNSRVSAADIEWSNVDLGDERLIRRCLDEVSQDAGPKWSERLEVALGIVLCQSNAHTDRIRLLRGVRNRRMVGWVLCIVEPAAFVYALGEITIWRWRTERVRLIGGDCVIYTDVDRDGIDAQETFFVEALKLIFREAAGKPCFLQALPSDSALCQIVNDELGRAPYRLMRFGSVVEHLFIDPFKDFESFVAGLSTSTRGTLRYMRRLTRSFDGKVRLRVFGRPEEVPLFLDDAVPVSRETYQWRLVGAGLRSPPDLIRRFEFAARLGWWRSYVLYVNGEATAFLEGYVMAGTYVVYDMGYRPAWGRWNVGTATLLEALREMKASASEVKRVDFLYGDQEYKRRYANARATEMSYYLIPRSAFGYFVLCSVSLTNRTSEVIGKILDRHGLKSRVRKFVRQLSRARTSRE